MTTRIRLCEDSRGTFHLESAHFGRWQPAYGSLPEMNYQEAEEEMAMWLAMIDSLKRDPDCRIEKCDSCLQA